MSEAPIQLIVAAFNDEQAADEALKELKAAKKEHLIGIQAAAVVRRDEKNKLHVKEVGELTPRKGALGGAALGAAIGILTGGIGLVLGAAGALAGFVVGKVTDQGFDNARLKQIGESLKPGTSAIMAIIEHKWVTQLEEELEELGADVMTAAIAADIADQLAQGRDVSYSALADESSLETSRVAAGEDYAEVSRTTYTDDTVVSEAAVVSPEGIAGERITETAEGTLIEDAMITAEGAAYAATAVTDEGIEVAAIAAVVEDDDDEVVEEDEDEPTT